MEIRDDIIGSRRRSSAVESRRRIKIGHELLLYDSKKWAYMCKQRSQVRRVVDKKDSGAVHSGQPGRMHIKKNKIKTRQKEKIRFA